MAANKQTRNDRPAALALIGICILFLAVVGRGWQALFSSQSLFVSLAVGGVVALIAIALAYAIAAEKNQTQQFNSTAWAYFFVLFNISALGTINTMFLTFQSDDVLRNEIDKASIAIAKLKESGDAYLKPRLRGYDSFIASVKQNQERFFDEIKNPVNCGQGPVATQHARALQNLLPSFRMLVGKADCSRTEQLLSAYQEKIEHLVKNSPQYLAVKIDADLKNLLDGESENMYENLTKVRQMIGAKAPLGDIKKELFQNAEQYLRLRLEFGTRISNNQAPDKIDTSEMSALGNIGQVLPFILSRLGEISTYVFLVIAVLLDLTVIAAFDRVMRSGPNNRQKAGAATPRPL